MPGLQQAADSASLVGQRWCMRLVAARVIFAIAATVSAIIATNPKLETAGLYLVAASFLIALILEVLLWVLRLERSWYDGRAIAESAKSLTWRFAVAAKPYPAGDASSESRFLDDLQALLHDAPATGIAPSTDRAISANVRALRTAPLDARRETYLRDRIDDQCSWYTRKADVNATRATQLRVLLVVAEFVAVLLALLRAGGAIGIDFAGILAAAIAGIWSWMGVRQHEPLARAYKFAAHDLAIARERVETCTDELAWAAEAADAEEAISREHTMWRASRASS